jgi:hypothetical protein
MVTEDIRISRETGCPSTLAHGSGVPPCNQTSAQRSSPLHAKCARTRSTVAPQTSNRCPPCRNRTATCASAVEQRLVSEDVADLASVTSYSAVRDDSPLTQPTAGHHQELVLRFWHRTVVSKPRSAAADRVLSRRMRTRQGRRAMERHRWVIAASTASAAATSKRPDWCAG